ncbi:hypothetical protein OK074_2668 [Actinobacteria bacterium OK074]|nr:hypothetical protein OK074_2668 [Actinobacteria bacterium OK074]
MTPGEFRRQHGDPSTWTPQEFEAYLDACDAPDHEIDAVTFVLTWSPEPARRAAGALTPERGEQR